jgi:hypothetical protein
MTSFDLRANGAMEIRDVGQSYDEAARKSQFINRAAVILKNALGLPGHEDVTEDDLKQAREFVALVASAVAEQAGAGDRVEVSSPYLPSPEFALAVDLDKRALDRVARLGRRLFNGSELDEQDVQALDIVVDAVGKSTSALYQRMIHG